TDFEEENFMTAANFTRYIAEFGDNRPTREVDDESAKEVTAALVPYLSSAITEDWLDFHEDYEE
ncbi:MAG: hypothetical protein LBS91_06820, partial [Clostridiales Family XIII bacterium]|nr:hypothetical protein [Clostridiales Family XIII bacterium]